MSTQENLYIVALKVSGKHMYKVRLKVFPIEKKTFIAILIDKYLVFSTLLPLVLSQVCYYSHHHNNACGCNSLDKC